MRKLNFTYKCIKCDAVMAKSSAPIEVDPICWKCETRSDAKQRDVMNKTFERLLVPEKRAKKEKADRARSLKKRGKNAKN